MDGSARRSTQPSESTLQTRKLLKGIGAHGIYLGSLLAELIPCCIDYAYYIMQSALEAKHQGVSLIFLSDKTQLTTFRNKTAYPVQRSLA